MGRGDIALKGDWLGMTGDVRAKPEESEVIEAWGGGRKKFLNGRNSHDV